MNNIKKVVKEKIKKYSNEEYLDGYIKNEFLTDNGNADIFLKINNKEELIDTRTVGNQLDLNKSVYDYIDDKASMLNNNIKLNLHILENVLTKDEEEKVKHIISEHYAIELYKIQKDYRRYKHKIFKLCHLGLIFLLFYAAIALAVSESFFIEIFIFLFSFTLWEAFDTFIYTLSDIKLKREKVTQKLVMAITIDNDKKGE